jgi:hypothetical protein
VVGHIVGEEEQSSFEDEVATIMRDGKPVEQSFLSISNKNTIVILAALPGDVQ